MKTAHKKNQEKNDDCCSGIEFGAVCLFGEMVAQHSTTEMDGQARSVARQTQTPCGVHPSSRQKDGNQRTNKENSTRLEKTTNKTKRKNIGTSHTKYGKGGQWPFLPRRIQSAFAQECSQTHQRTWGNACESICLIDAADKQSWWWRQSAPKALRRAKWPPPQKRMVAFFSFCESRKRVYGRPNNKHSSLVYTHSIFTEACAEFEHQ